MVSSAVITWWWWCPALAGPLSRCVGGVRLQPARYHDVLVASGFSRTVIVAGAGAFLDADWRMFPRHPERLKTFSYLGLHRYHLRFCTHQRLRIFVVHPAVETVLREIRRAAGAEQFAILAYCFMPDHVHLIVQGIRETADLKRFATRAKQFSGYAHAKSGGTRLWQRYLYEHVLRDDETTAAAVRYVLTNPVRAGLVHRPQDYPFLGSDVFGMTELLEIFSNSWSG